MTDERTLREGLLGLDTIKGDQRESYDAALAALFEHKFGRGERALYVAATVGGGTVAMGLSALVVSEPSTTPAATRALLAAIALMGLFWCLLCGRALWRGRVGVQTDQRWAAVGAMTCAVLQTVFFGWRAASEAGTGAGFAGLGLSIVFVVLAAVVLIMQGLRELELRTRERELSERLARPDG